MKKSLLALALGALCCQGLWADAITAPEAGKDYYIRNAANAEMILTTLDNSVMIAPEDAARFQRMQFVPVMDGDNIVAYNIQLANGKYLATDNGWTCIQSTDASSTSAQVTIAAVGTDAVKFTFKSSNKCLGSDNTATTANGQGVYTDKNGNEARFQWVIEAAPAIAAPSTDKYYTIENAGKCLTQNGFTVDVKDRNAKSNYQIFKFAKAGDNYTIQTWDEFLIGSDGNMADLLMDATDAKAQFALTAADGSVLLKNAGVEGENSCLAVVNGSVVTNAAATAAGAKWVLREVYAPAAFEKQADTNVANLVKNGDFQAEGTATGNIPNWTANITENADWIGTVTIAEKANVAGDNYVACLMDSWTTWWGAVCGIQQEIDVTVGQEYQFSFDYLFDSPTRSAWHARVYYVDGEDNKQNIYSVDGNGAVNKWNWSQVKGSFTPTTDKVTVSIYSSHEDSKAAERQVGIMADNITVLPFKAVVAEAVKLNYSQYQFDEVAGSLQLRAIVSPREAEDRAVVWASSNDGIATVDENGLVTPVGIGLVEITATTANGVVGVCKVTVVKPIVINSELTNGSFEDDADLCVDDAAVNNGADGLRGYNVAPTGWNVTTTGVDLLIAADCFTDNNFGKTRILDGEYAFYQRVGWTDAVGDINQLISLPAGEYTLSFGYKAYYANNPSLSRAYVKDEAGNTLNSCAVNFEKGSAGIMADSKWKVAQLKFTLAADAVITIGVETTFFSGGSCIALDNFTFGEISDEPVDGLDRLDADQEAPAYFNLQGLRVANPAPGQIYIRVQGSTATKVLF